MKSAKDLKEYMEKMEEIRFRKYGELGSNSKCSCCGRILPSDNFIEKDNTLRKIGYGTWGRMKITEYNVKENLCLDCYYYMIPIKKKFNIAMGVILCTNLLALGSSFFFHRFDTKVYLWWIGILVVVTWLIWAIKQIYSDSKARNYNKDNPVCLHTTRPSVSKNKEKIQGCLGILFIIGVIVGIFKCNSQHRKEVSDWNNNVHVTMVMSGEKIDIPKEAFYKEHPNLKSNVYCINDTKKVLAIYVVYYSYSRNTSNLSISPHVTDIIRPGDYFFWMKGGDGYIEFKEPPYLRSGLSSTTLHVVTYLDSLPSYVEMSDSIRQLIKHE